MRLDFSNAPKIQGSIVISHDITCPHCYETFYDNLDKEWWNKNVTDQLPSNDSYSDTYNIQCKECRKLFIVEGFIS